MSISSKNLTKTFGTATAIRDVSFSVPEGAFFAVVGASGCGKSTLLRLIAGLEEPDAGSIALRGETVAGPGVFVPPEERGVGVVFQSYALWPHLTVTENVAFPYQARGLSAAEARTKANEHVRMVALDALKDRRPDALSGGQRQRVALARCLAGEARTILMDEPLANLDPHLRGEMEAELRAFHDRNRVTTLYITHDQREAMALADVMAVMEAGRILQIGAPHTIYDRPANESVARFIGRGCILDARLENGAAVIGDQTVPMATETALAERPSKVLVRPRDVTVSETGLAARVTSVHYRGGVWEASAEAEGLTEPLLFDTHQPVAPGEIVRLSLKGCWPLPS